VTSAGEAGEMTGYLIVLVAWGGVMVVFGLAGAVIAGIAQDIRTLITSSLENGNPVRSDA
jgi:hypothetical protein